MKAIELAKQAYQEQLEQEHKYHIQKCNRFADKALKKLAQIFPESDIKTQANGTPDQRDFIIDDELTLRAETNFNSVYFRIQGNCPQCIQCFSNLVQDNIVEIGKMIIDFKPSRKHREAYHKSAKPEYDAVESLIDALRELLDIE